MILMLLMLVPLGPSWASPRIQAPALEEVASKSTGLVQGRVVAAVTRALRRAYPGRLNASNQTAITMMLFGMINWTFTWLRPGGPISYVAFADEVIALLEKGLN
jgi:hypothetical protein